MKKINIFCMQAAEDAERIIALGAPRENVKVTGNMKFDIDTNKKDRFTDLKGLLNRPLRSVKRSHELIIAGSTHKGEEEIVLEVYGKLLEKFQGLKLLIAPRHIDRAESIRKLIRETGLGEGGLSVLDTHGELSQLYRLATIVFMGGSLIRRGGHNIVEPAQFGKPIIFGPFMFNFRDMARSFLAADAAIEVEDKHELLNTLGVLLGDEDKRNILGGNAKALIERSRGATDKNIQELTNILHK